MHTLYISPLSVSHQLIRRWFYVSGAAVGQVGLPELIVK
jgi:hypothetical protein